MINVSDPNTVIPRPLVEFKSSSDLIEKFIRDHLEKAKNLGPNKKIEIEARIGYSLKSRDLVWEQSKPIIATLSNRDPIIIGSNVPGLVQEYFSTENMISQNYKLDKPDINLKMFQNLFNYFELHSSLTAKKKTNLIIEPALHSLSIDFNLADQSRLTLDLFLKTWTLIKKQDRDNLDIMRRGNLYRISCSIEETLPFNENEVDFSTVKCIRIKNRTGFKFQYMEYDFTEVIDLSSFEQSDVQCRKFQDLKLLMNDKDIVLETKIEGILHTMTQIKLEALEKYEIEVEIHKPKYLMDHLPKFAEFSSLIKKFIKNVESLFYMEKELYNQISKNLIGVQEGQAPIISQYLTHLYEKKIVN